MKFTGLETRGDGNNNNKWVTCGEFNAKKVVEDTLAPTPTAVPTTTPTAAPTNPGTGTAVAVPCTAMAVKAFSSNETAAEDRPAGNLVDRRQEPGWTSAWSTGSTPPPHWVIIDLGKQRRLAWAGCQGRESANDRIKDVTMETSLDGDDWSAPVAATSENTTAVQTVALAGAGARYVRMTGVSSYDGKWIACGEFVAAEMLDGPAPSATAVPTTAAPSTTPVPTTTAPTATPSASATAAPSATPTTVPTATAVPTQTAAPTATESLPVDPTTPPGNGVDPGTTAPAPTAGPSGTAQKSPNGSVTVAQGGRLDLAAVGFAAGEDVAAVIRSTPVDMGTFTADGLGQVRVEWSVPLDFAVGAHTVTLTGLASGHVETIPVLVTAASTTAGPDGLARTGPEGLATVMVLGLGVALGGLALMLRARRMYMPKRA